MTTQTAAARAAAARLRRRTTRPGGAVAKDPCPECGVELGRPKGTSRRRVLFTSDRGSFRWQCPDCRASWTEAASTQAGSTTRGAALPSGSSGSSVPSMPAGPSRTPLPGVTGQATAQASSNQTTLPAPSR